MARLLYSASRSFAGTRDSITPSIVRFQRASHESQLWSRARSDEPRVNHKAYMSVSRQRAYRESEDEKYEISQFEQAGWMQRSEGCKSEDEKKYEISRFEPAGWMQRSEDISLFTTPLTREVSIEGRPVG